MHFIGGWKNLQAGKVGLFSKFCTPTEHTHLNFCPPSYVWPSLTCASACKPLQYLSSPPFLLHSTPPTPPHLHNTSLHYTLKIYWKLWTSSIWTLLPPQPPSLSPPNLTFIILQSPLHTLDLLNAVNLFKMDGWGFCLCSTGNIGSCSRSWKTAINKIQSIMHHQSHRVMIEWSPSDVEWPWTSLGGHSPNSWNMTLDTL